MTSTYLPRRPRWDSVQESDDVEVVPTSQGAKPRLITTFNHARRSWFSRPCSADTLFYSTPMPKRRTKRGLLQGARVYLSGPMDFVASRAAEKQFGWRNRISEFLQSMGTTVFDPWFKPEVRGLHEYGREDVKSGDKIRTRWTYEGGKKGAQERSWCARQFWETLHIDLRMVDTSDFSISYCPTNIYSVGTPHEIITATVQHKPVLFVSPPIVFPALADLRHHLK